MANLINDKKIGIIGLGNVGASIAFILASSPYFNEIVLIDNNIEKAKGEALDISHGLSFNKPVKVYQGDYDDLIDSKIIIITAGANQKEDETRLDLVFKNVKIYQEIIKEIAKRNYEGMLLIVSNPVDILTYITLKLGNFKVNKVIGSGTLLDTSRLKYNLGEHLNVDPRFIDAFIVGEHGDSEIVLWSRANVSGIPLAKFCELRGYYNHDYQTNKIAKIVKDSAYQIIKKKKATYYGIALSTKRIVEAIINDEKAILPISSLLNGEYGINDLALSIPTIIGKEGIIEHLILDIDDKEKEGLIDSANKLKEIINQLNI